MSTAPNDYGVPPPVPPDDPAAWYAPGVRAQYEVYPGVVVTIRDAHLEDIEANRTGERIKVVPRGVERRVPHHTCQRNAPPRSHGVEERFTPLILLGREQESRMVREWTELSREFPVRRRW